MDTLYQSLGGPFLLLIIFPLIIYGMVFLPQQKKLKNHQDLLHKLQRGDHVLTTGGIIGIVDQVMENRLLLTVAKGMNITLKKDQIVDILPPETSLLSFVEEPSPEISSQEEISPAQVEVKKASPKKKRPTPSQDSSKT